MVQVRSKFVENGSQSFAVGDNVKKGREREDDLDSDIVSDSGSDYSDEDDDCLVTLDAKDVHAKKHNHLKIYALEDNI
ncbi:hypothetical protein CFP56_025996 [Quercus suber]|uniref:Uncharacterized protein n=1 Tax=Quercus suber TaxID=58331 RepID=A0AAW0LY08_QUESU